MKSVIKFIKASWHSLILSPEGGLSLPKALMLVTSCVATYKFVIAETNDPWLWLVYLGVVGGHSLAGKAVEAYVKRSTSA